MLDFCLAMFQPGLQVQGSLITLWEVCNSLSKRQDAC